MGRMVSREEVEKAIEEVRPYIRMDGGDVELVEIAGDVVKVRLKGACAHCPMAQLTLKMSIESHIRRKVPGVKTVEAV
jgi:Fe-S cluster biogenesis protein NfuA